MTPTPRNGRAKLSANMEKEEVVGAEEKPVRKPAPKQKKVVAARRLKSSAPVKTGQSAAESETSRKPTRRGKIANEADKAGKTDRAVKAVRDVEVDKANITANSTPKKNKLRRDSYSIPESEHKQLTVLKKRCADQGRPIKKSYLLRAGIQALTRMNDKEFFTAIERIK